VGGWNEALVAIDDQHAGPTSREEDAGGPPVADAVTGGAATGDDRYSSRESRVVFGPRRLTHVETSQMAMGAGARGVACHCSGSWP